MIRGWILVLQWIHHPCQLIHHLLNSNDRILLLHLLNDLHLRLILPYIIQHIRCGVLVERVSLQVQWSTHLRFKHLILLLQQLDHLLLPLQMLNVDGALWALRLQILCRGYDVHIILDLRPLWDLFRYVLFERYLGWLNIILKRCWWFLLRNSRYVGQQRILFLQIVHVANQFNINRFR